MGIGAVLGGVGGGVLFVPIISGFFPFHLDFVRGAGLLVALAGALAAGPGLLKMNLASLRLAIPVALIASTFSIVGAMIGLALPTNVIQIALGVTILGICILMLTAKKSELPEVPQTDPLSSALRIYGVYQEASTGQVIDWKIRRTAQGLVLFIAIGIMAGMFGLGAGWANVPVLNLLMGAPLKISVATSKFLLSITDTSAAWIYMNNGCVIPMIVVPSIIGIMLGSFVGVALLRRTKPGLVPLDSNRDAGLRRFKSPDERTRNLTAVSQQQNEAWRLLWMIIPKNLCKPDRSNWHMQAFWKKACCLA